MEILEMLPIVLNVFFVVQIISAGAMCIYGYKWRKGLIAILSVRIGIILGILFASFLLNQDYDLIVPALLSIFIIAILFHQLAYRWVPLNHFLTGFLVGNKIAFMFIYNLMTSGGIKFNITLLMVVPLIIGAIVGFIVSSIFTNVAVLLCIVYIGTTELVTGIADLINKTLFLATGDIGYIFHIEDVLLKIVGVDIPSFVEVIFIIIVGIVSFVWQKYLLDEEGIDLSNRVIDDRNYQD